jgi:hypothetical protein
VTVDWDPWQSPKFVDPTKIMGVYDKSAFGHKFQ